MTYDAPPVRWDHELVVGDTYAPGSVTLVDGEGAPIDLTGATGVCHLRAEPGEELALAATVAFDSPETDGVFRWSATAAATAELAVGTYRFAVRLTFGDSTVRTILEGTVRVRRVAVG